MGVDTVILGLNGFGVREEHGLTVQPASYVPRTGEQIGCYRLWKGMEASRAFHNASGKWHLDVKAYGGQVRGMVHLSLPGYGAPNNLNPVDREKAVAILEDVRKGLSDVGVDCNLEDARVSRLDAFSNVQTTEPFDTYSPILSLLDGKRMRDKVMFGGSAFRWGSSHSQINCYDKLEEMRSHKLDVSAYAGRNVVRFEHRSLDRSKVQSLYGFDTVGDFLREYDSIPSVYRSVMQRDLFRYDGEDVEVLSSKQIEDELRLFREVAGRYWMSEYLQATGMKALLQRASIDTISKAVASVSGNRMSGTRNRARMHKALVRQSLLTRSNTSLRTFKVLYDELKAGVLLAA